MTGKITIAIVFHKGFAKQSAAASIVAYQTLIYEDSLGLHSLHSQPWEEGEARRVSDFPSGRRSSLGREGQQNKTITILLHA